MLWLWIVLAVLLLALIIYVNAQRLFMCCLRCICYDVHSCASRCLLPRKDELFDFSKKSELDRLRERMDSFMAATADAPNALKEGLANGKQIKFTNFEIKSRSGGGLALRAYVPTAAPPEVALLFIHGGGFCLGSLRGYDHVCRAISLHTGFVVIYVNYRLAPEVKFPQPLYDCHDALLWMADNAPKLWNTKYLGVSGDSAGGNLAGAVTRWNRDHNGPQLLFHLLASAAIDYKGLDNTAAFKNYYPLKRGMMKSMWETYLSGEDDKRNPYCCLLSASEYKGLPPAMVVLAENDSLTPEGEEYARALQRDGVPVYVKNYARIQHAFFVFPTVIKDAIECYHEVRKFAGHLIAKLNGQQGDPSLDKKILNASAVKQMNPDANSNQSNPNPNPNANLAREGKAGSEEKRSNGVELGQYQANANGNGRANGHQASSKASHDDEDPDVVRWHAQDDSKGVLPSNSVAIAVNTA